MQSKADQLEAATKRMGAGTGPPAGSLRYLVPTWQEVSHPPHSLPTYSPSVFVDDRNALMQKDLR
jgi:hypothetical protein